MQGIILDVGEEASIRARWLSCHGFSLPSTIPFFYEVGQAPDSDEEGILVPGCCVWAGSGLVPAPEAASRRTTDASIMQQVGCHHQGGIIASEAISHGAIMCNTFETFAVSLLVR